MRDYGKVGPKFWIGATGKKLRAAGAEAQVVALYLMTSPHANMLGLYYLPQMFIAHETGLGIEGASKGLQSAIEAGFCEYNEASETVWVIEMAKYQIADSLTGKDLRIKGVQNEYDSLPTNPYLARFYDQYAAAFCMSSKRGLQPSESSPFKAPSKPLVSQEQEQEQEQEQDTEAPDGAVTTAAAEDDHDDERADESAKGKGVPACPVGEIVNAFHDLMPLNPKVRVLDDARKKTIRARWREASLMAIKPFGYATAADGLAAWKQFFEVCADSPFLTGRTKAREGHPPFVADIDFLMSPSGFKKCLENKYHRDAS